MNHISDWMKRSADVERSTRAANLQAAGLSRSRCCSAVGSERSVCDSESPRSAERADWAALSLNSETPSGRAPPEAGRQAACVGPVAATATLRVWYPKQGSVRPALGSGKGALCQRLAGRNAFVGKMM